MLIFILLKQISSILIGILISINQPQLIEINHDWISVPASKYGEQLWDKKSINLNEDGSVRVLSKFIPKTKTEITTDIFYMMDINCFERTFRDVGVDSQEFKEVKTQSTKWKYPNGDKLILGVIRDVCNYEVEQIDN